MTTPTEAKAGCLYPNNARALMEARTRGFDNCLLFDMLGNVAELATANVFLAKDGEVADARGQRLVPQRRDAPARARSCSRHDGKPVRETTLSYADFETADEIFVVGNFGKVTPVRRIDERDLQPGPMFRRARELYWQYAHSG